MATDDVESDKPSCWSRTRAYVDSFKTSRKLVLFVVFLALLLDNMLLTTVVPIIPSYLLMLRTKEARSEKLAMLASKEQVCQPKHNFSSAFFESFRKHEADFSFCKQVEKTTRKKFKIKGNSTTKHYVNVTKAKSDLHNRIAGENVEVGLMFASKAIVQLITNPFVGPITNRIGYSIPMFFGFIVMFFSTMIFAFGKTYWVLLLARSCQGIGSACTSVSGMGMLAHLYPDDRERGNAMGVALGGLALGVLVGPPYGGILYQFVNKEAPFLILSALILMDLCLQLLILKPSVQKESKRGSSLKELLSDPYILIAAGSITFANMGIAMLEPSLPLWMIEKMNAQKWQQGAAFLPASISYLIGTNLFGPLAHRIGRWLSAGIGMFVIGLCLVCVPFATDPLHLIAPNFGLGFSIGMVDSSMMPIMGHLVDLRHVPIYGSVYAIADVAFCLGFAVGPAVSGLVIGAVGFPWMLRIMAIVCFLFTPLHLFLRNPPSRHEKQNLMPDAIDEATPKNDYEQLNN